MALRDELLEPIAGDNPGGADVRYDPIFDKIKEARREDDDIPQGEWATTRKTAEWPVVIKLAREALSKKSKDLQIAAWLTEALLKTEGFAGLRDGFDLMTAMLERFWDHLYPEIDDGDAEMRAAPLEWVALKLDGPVRLSAIDRNGHTLLQYKESRLIPTEAQTVENPEKLPAREAAIADGKTTPEDIDAGFGATPKAWYRTLVADVQASIEALDALDSVATDKFADVAPSFSKLKEALEEFLRTANGQLKRKLEVDPDPIEVATEEPAAAEGASESAAAVSSATGAPRALAAEPTSTDDAAARVMSAAKYLRRASPFNPAPYLMVRGYRWGELRASRTLDPKLLEAPPTVVRTTLKGLLLDSRWSDLLEAAEGVMATPQGRGWLDLQRYAVTAAEALGSDYDAVASAMRGALRSLLLDLPRLLDMTLMDDTPTANSETRAWLRDLMKGAAPADGEGSALDLPIDDDEPRSRDPIALANSEVRAGRADRAIALLMKESGREKTKRGRFLMQAQLARIMVDAGHYPVAMPILEQLIADIEAYRLEEWETGETVAAPMALMYTCLEKLDGDSSLRQNLYLRICRLDPIQAISFSQA
jgi:type VI secretion system protein ImpA